MLLPEASYALPHHTPPSHPREPREAARTSQKNPFPSLPHSQCCSSPAQDEVWGVQKEGASIISWRGQIYFPSLSKAANAPWLVFTPSISTPPFAPCSSTPSVYRDQGSQGQVCSQSCARGLWPHQQHQTPSPAWCLCHPNLCTGLLSPSCHKSWQQLQQDTRCGTAGVPCRVS